MSRDYFKRRCEILETILANQFDPITVPGGPCQQEAFFKKYMGSDHCFEPPVSVISFVDSFFEESWINAGISPQGRRWSPSVALFSFLIRSLGSKCYDHLRRIVCMPSKSTLLAKFGSLQQKWGDVLIDLERSSEICDLFCALFQIEAGQSVEAVLGIDAMAIEPTKHKEGGVDAGCNNVFLFYLMPLRTEYKCLPLHLMTRKTGNAGPDVIERAERLIAELKRRKISVRAIATDGDSGYAQLHRGMLDRWFTTYKRSGLDSVLDNCPEGDHLFVADLLHILKNARSRLLANDLTIRVDGSFPFGAAILNQLLSLGSALTDKSSTGKMRDAYALEIFTLENVLRLIDSAEWIMAYYILPFALWTTAVRYHGVSSQTRLDFLNISFEIFADHMSHLKCLDESKVSQNKAPGRVQYCCSERQCIRILNSLLVTIMELRRSPDNLALGRIGTHNLECQFGTIRLLCHHKHSWKMVLRAFSKVTLLKEAITLFGQTFQVRERENVAGVKIRPCQSGPLIYIPRPECSHSLHECFCFKALECTNPDSVKDVALEVVERMRSELDMFVDFLVSFSDESKRMNLEATQLWPCSTVANNGIIARLISFRSHDGNKASAGQDDDFVDGETIEGDDEYHGPFSPLES